MLVRFGDEGVIATYLAQGGQCVVLDGAVEPSKQDGHRPEQDVDWVAQEVSDELDELGEYHPRQ